ncbi:uncharacterized protein K441DRAFT_659892 [Cenococcum geophilum 1.58]|uniref:uncharacterized protein n=1 Tax=Cenococcum geophilum 1.58 TaxID=794803 RepID=UPI00358DE6B6|nr:hypothetical protein K441DRAFT_659892 [Cenococcum geophilum 1.58]
MADTKNIYIVGAQCTGKTTLVHALSKFFETQKNRCLHGEATPKPYIINEVARNVLREHRFTASDITSSKSRAAQLQKLILAAQCQIERETQRNGWYISDRSALDPIVYARYYVGEDAAEEMMKSEEWLEMWECMKLGLVFVCESGVPWLFDDGIRVMPDDVSGWVKFHDLFCKMLNEAGVEYYLLPKTMLGLEERLAMVLSVWKEG